MDNANYEYRLRELIDTAINVIESNKEEQEKQTLIRTMMEMESIISVLRWYPRYNSNGTIIIED